jgi:hypothetical protein
MISGKSVNPDAEGPYLQETSCYVPWIVTESFFGLKVVPVLMVSIAISNTAAEMVVTNAFFMFSYSLIIKVSLNCDRNSYQSYDYFYSHANIF